MEFTTLDNITYKVTLKSKPRSNQSQYHQKAIELIQEKWPTVTIVEELAIKVTKNLTLYLDIFIPIFWRTYEVMGVQHYSYSSFFHQSKMNLYYQQKLDRLKKEWCEVNNIEYIELSYNKINDWGNLINGH